MVEGRLSFKQYKAVGCCQDIAYDIGTGRAPWSTASTFDYKSKHMASNSRHPVDHFLVAVVHSPTFYWMMVQKNSATRRDLTMYRELASGSSVVVSYEADFGGTQACMTVFWANAQILAGEAQFSQLMRTLFGNLSERGFDATGYCSCPSVGSFVPTQDTPSSLQLPDTEIIQFTTNIELGESIFVAEGEGLQHSGTGPDLVQMELGSTKIQHKLTAGMPVDFGVRFMHWVYAVTAGVELQEEHKDLL